MEIPRGTLTILNRNRGEIAIEEAYGLRPEEQAKGKYTGFTPYCAGMIEECRLMEVIDNNNSERMREK